MEVESTLDRLREATTAINTAKDDKHLRAILEKTWLLQDRLSFSDQVCSIPSIEREYLLICV